MSKFLTESKENNKHLWWSIAIKNSIAIICWTVLAIIFNKWWVALFAVLFLSGVISDFTTLYYRTCDKCGKRSEGAFSYEGAIEKAKKAGWVLRMVNGKYDDRCPDCRD